MGRRSNSKKKSARNSEVRKSIQKRSVEKLKVEKLKVENLKKEDDQDQLPKPAELSLEFHSLRNTQEKDIIGIQYTSQNKSSIQKQKEIEKENQKKQEEQLLEFRKNKNYITLFESVIDDKSNWPKKVDCHEIYHLIEDIAILFFVTQLNQANVPTGFWKFLTDEQIFQRTAESLRIRHKNYIQNLESPDIAKIWSHVQEFGPKGFIQFRDDGEKKRFDCICIEKSAITQKSKPKMVECEAKAKNLIQLIRQMSLRDVSVRDLYKSQLLQLLKSQGDLEWVVEYASDMFGMKELEILQQLKSVSGDYSDFFLMLNQKVDKCSVYWEQKEDQILRENDARKIKELGRTKSQHNVSKRRRFLNIMN